mmetsp:Transcript_22091/g.42098  ORF Transcript_22091/g.42098 Transcript_22091/m.42098 type:complete len:261 (+) Transcript_22091:68-850(+)
MSARALHQQDIPLQACQRSPFCVRRARHPGFCKNVPNQHSGAVSLGRTPVERSPSESGRYISKPPTHPRRSAPAPPHQASPLQAPSPTEGPSAKRKLSPGSSRACSKCSRLVEDTERAAQCCVCLRWYHAWCSESLPKRPRTDTPSITNLLPSSGALQDREDGFHHLPINNFSCERCAWADSGMLQPSHLQQPGADPNETKAINTRARAMSRVPSHRSFVEVLDMTQKVEPTCAACIDGASDIESHIFPEGCCSEVKILD